MHGEMPGFFPGRPGGEHDEPLLDMILERRPIPPGAPPEIHGLARMLAAVGGPAEPGDLAGQDAAQAAFTRLTSRVGTSHAALRSARRSLSERPARGRLPLAALAVAAAGLGSTVAAYADVLPSPIQHFAHVTFGAPAPPQDASPGTLTITGSLAPRHTTPGTSGSARRHSAASSGPASGKTRSGPPGSPGWKGHGAVPGLASCLATPGQDRGGARGHSQNPLEPSPAPNQAKPGSAQGQAGSGPGQNTVSPGSVPSGWPTMPSPTTACPNGAVPANGAHASG
jgi:hypothetical protein